MPLSYLKKSENMFFVGQLKTLFLYQITVICKIIKILYCFMKDNISVFAIIISDLRSALISETRNCPNCFS